MDNDQDRVGEAGNRFFGRISATVSHEIKNGLAVINENAGLLKDLILMAEQGRPLDPARVKNIADKVLERVEKADHVVRNLNRFAHKVDEPVATVDLSENLNLMVELTGRLASNRGKTIRVAPPDSPVQITTNPFALLNLCWCGMETAMEAAPGNPELTVEIQKLPRAVEVRMGAIEDFELVSKKFSGETEQTLAKYLRAEVVSDTERKTIVLVLPEKLHSV
jgi:signal transduction histidine kinase